MAAVTTRALDAVGLVDRRDPRTEYHVAQTAMAVVTSLLLGALWLVLRRLLDPSTATVAALLLGTEPLAVAHGARLHTDALLALFMALATCSAAIAVGLHRPPAWDRPIDHRWFAAAGAWAGLAFLTKLNGLLVVPMVAVVVVVAAVRARAVPGRLARALAWGAAAFVVPCLVLWPAVWADPLGVLRLLRATARLAGPSSDPYFFRGSVVAELPRSFYAYALAYRLTPWLIGLAGIGAVVALVTVAGARRSARLREARAAATVALVLAGTAAGYLAVASAVAKKAPRYALPVLPALAVLAALAVVASCRWLARNAVDRARTPASSSASRGVPVWQRRGDLWQLGGLGLLAVALVVHALAQAPYESVYADPLLGGPVAAARTLTVGEGEGLRQFGDAAAADARRRGEPCADVRIAVQFPKNGAEAFRCGFAKASQDLRPGQVGGIDYAVLYINQLQKRVNEPFLDEVRRRGTPIFELRIRGVDYGELYRIDH